MEHLVFVRNGLLSFFQTHKYHIGFLVTILLEISKFQALRHGLKMQR